MEIEKEEEKQESFYLLKDIQKSCKDFVNEIFIEHKKKTLDDYKKIISNIKTCSELNYSFLRYLKDNNISYEENGEKCDYKSNFVMLKETLTNEQFKLLEGGNRDNPLDEIFNLLKEYVSNQENDIKDGYKNLMNKYPISFVKLNSPLVLGIERLRVKYYRDLLVEKIFLMFAIG